MSRSELKIASLLLLAANIFLTVMYVRDGCSMLMFLPEQVCGEGSGAGFILLLDWTLSAGFMFWSFKRVDK